MKKIKRFVAVLLVVLCFGGLAVSANTDTPTETFTRTTGEKTVPTKPVYAVERRLDVRNLNISGELGNIQDIDHDEDGNLYVLTSNSRLFRISDDDMSVYEYHIQMDGRTVDFTGAEGIRAISKENLYLADTKNGRILQIENEKVSLEIETPQSELIPDNFDFQPAKIAVDKKGYIYAASKGSYLGALLFTPEGEFSAFFGANTVKGTFLTVLSNIWNRLTQNDVKRSKSRKTLPYDFSDIFVDASGFVYTSTGMNANGDVGQIRKLSPSGTNILSNSDSINYGEKDKVKRLNYTVKQNFSGISADADGFIYALDSEYGLIYIYDEQSNLLAAFGGGRGLGNQNGTFVSACSMTLSEDKLYVADSFNQNITVFSKTEFGKNLFSAQKATIDSDYEVAKPLWNKVLASDSMNYLAYKGLSRAAYSDGDWEAAMNYAEACSDSELYSLALKEVNSEFQTRNFAWILLIAVSGCIGLVVLIIISIRKKLVIIRNAKLQRAVSAMYHPFAAFYDIKYRGLGSLALATIFTVLFFLSGAVNTINSDFRYTSFDAATYNVAFQAVQTIGLVLLWTVANWGVCTLIEGKGKLKEVFTVTAYSTLPIIIYNFVSTPLSHILTSENSAAISGLRFLAYAICGIMLAVGLMTIHDISFPRFIMTAVLTVLHMILFVFVLFMVGILLTQFYNFIFNIIEEGLQWKAMQ